MDRSETEPPIDSVPHRQRGVMEQSEALATVETALRSIVRHLLGDTWYELLRPNQLDKARDRRQKEPRQRPGALETDDLLSYVDTPDLTGLVMGKWDTFAPVFQNDNRTKAAFDTLNVYRRRVAHNRPLLTFERDLLSGISGVIRNQIAIFVQKQQPVPSFYAQIETAVDQEGRVGLNPTDAYGPGPWPIIRAGETLTFTCNATDPRGRNLEWALSVGQGSLGGHSPTYEGKHRGDSILLSWTPTESYFAPTVYVFVSVRNMSPYNRGAQYDFMTDDVVVWPYTFEPPY